VRSSFGHSYKIAGFSILIKKKTAEQIIALRYPLATCFPAMGYLFDEMTRDVKIPTFFPSGRTNMERVRFAAGGVFPEAFIKNHARLHEKTAGNDRPRSGADRNAIRIFLLDEDHAEGSPVFREYRLI